MQKLMLLIITSLTLLSGCSSSDFDSLKESATTGLTSLSETVNSALASDNAKKTSPQSAEKDIPPIVISNSAYWYDEYEKNPRAFKNKWQGKKILLKNVKIVSVPERRAVEAITHREANRVLYVQHYPKKNEDSWKRRNKDTGFSVFFTDYKGIDDDWLKLNKGDTVNIEGTIYKMASPSGNIALYTTEITLEIDLYNAKFVK